MSRKKALVAPLVVLAVIALAAASTLGCDG